MSSYEEDLFYLDEDELLEELRGCLETEDRELAHKKADEIIVAALRLAVNEQISRNVTVELINTYHEVCNVEEA